jgi:hypothetical protein
MKDKITAKLIATGYRPGHAASFAERLAAAEFIQQELALWVESGLETDVAHEGYSALGLMSERDYTYPNALSVINWLKVDPEAAKSALQAGVNYISRGKNGDG